jgi:hypothetical protein
MKHTLAAVLLLASACKSDDPPASPDGPPRPDAEVADSGPDAVSIDADPSCVPLASDYQPRTGSDDEWPVCVSDDNLYHPFDASISTIARVAAFEEIATLLFTGATPSTQDFIDARVQYNLSEGLASRVQRREDEHYPPAMNMAGMVATCQSLPPDEQALFPERCVGPVLISPILEAGFDVGQTDASTDLESRVAAARIEAALLWFLYVSSYKEAITCTSVPRDCDSSFAYYTGGDPREMGKGLARYVRALDIETHDRVWDGILAVRCWRDLDNPGGVATDLEMRDRAASQMDRAGLRGVALIVRDRTADLATLTGDDLTVAWAFLQVLGPVLDRDASLRDSALAAQLRGELSLSNPANVDPDVILDALDQLYPCP